MKTSATNRRVRLLLTALKEGKLSPRPEFQRRLVWTNKHKQDFIKTVLLGYPFPEIYVAAGNVNPDTGEAIEMLVDGQQRITTLYQYFSGSDLIRLGDLRPYAALSSEEKIAFLEYEVVVRDLGNKSIEEIKEVFTRINSTKYSLNAMEIHNARFDGAFKRFGEELTQLPFFEENRVFKTTDIRRMGDLVFCLSVAISIITIYFNRDDELEIFLEKYNDEFPEEERIKKEIHTTLDFIRKCEFSPNSRAWRKAELLNLIIEFHRAIFKDKLPITPSETSKRLINFFNRVDTTNSRPTEYEEITNYYKASIQATNDRSNRIKRGNIIYKAIQNELPFLNQ